ncbi:MAG: DUF1343 domain-containing protein [Streptosporangiales bacterium]|nr:DUF1343 domain-containing protein [Streptosporangiales bacterium]
MLRGQRLGIVSNPTGVLRDYGHLVDALHAGGELTIGGVFGPEHGFRGSAQAGGSEGTTTDPRTGLTVYDAYGADPAKFAELYRKADVETVVFDIQDIGARFYTYIWTLYNAMHAAATEGLRFVVLDRPNPIGGAAGGPMMTAGYTSGVGLKEIVQRHGMTVGELARFYDGELLPDDAGARLGDALSVVEVAGWRRHQLAGDIDVPWVPPSPNIPTTDSATTYIGTCYFEGTNLSEGRGSTRPFEWIGAPWLDYRWADRLNTHELPGVRFREAYFTPSFSKHEGELCAGVQVHVTDPHAYDGITAAVAMLVEASKRDEFAWRYDDYDPDRPYWIDKLSGSPRLRKMVDAGATVAEIVASWQADLTKFEEQRAPYLLYR